MKVKVIKFKDNVKLPFRAHYNDAGADVYSLEDYILEPHTTVKLPLGFGIELPDGFQANVYPRSGLSSKGIILAIIYNVLFLVCLVACWRGHYALCILNYTSTSPPLEGLGEVIPFLSPHPLFLPVPSPVGSSKG